MKKILFLGDPHVTVVNLEESKRLLNFTLEQSKKADELVILGDLFHNHANVRIEVLEFWNKWLQILSRNIKTIVLVGNHDQVGTYNSNSHALSVFNNMDYENLHVVFSPVNFGIFGYIPYTHDNDKFVEAANQLAKEGAKVLTVHADLDGAQYENGFFCPNGIKQEDINCDLIIGGHIHKRSRFGKVILPGTARWLTSSDKNESKGLWLAEFDDNGKIITEEFLDTSHVCTPIYGFEFREGEAEPIIPEGSRTSIELIGSSEWVNKQKANFKGRASISTKITDKQKPLNRKTGNNLKDFISNTFEPIKGIKKDKILEFMKDLDIL